MNGVARLWVPQLEEGRRGIEGREIEEREIEGREIEEREIEGEGGERGGR